MFKIFSVIPRILQSRFIAVFLVAVFVSSGMITCYVNQPHLLKMIDHKIYDTIMKAQKESDLSSVPIIIDLDEESLEAFGQWPWPRFLIAELMYRLLGNGVQAVGLDMMLVEQDRASPKRLREDVKFFMGLDIEFKGLPEELYDYDQLMANAITGQPVVLGFYLNFDGQEAVIDTPPNPVGYVIQKTADSANFEEHVLKASSAILPYEAFREHIPLGLINMSPDEDGVVRRVPMLAMVGNKVYPTLSLRALMLTMGAKAMAIRMNQDGIESIRVGQRVIPLNADGSFVVPFKGPAKTFPYYSAKDILLDRVPAEELEGRIAFLGTSSAGLLDIRITPLERVYPGVETHATVLNAILQEEFLQTPAWTPGAQVLGIALCGLVSALVFGFASPLIYTLLGSIMLGGIVYSSFYLFERGYVISPLYISLTIAIVGVLLLLLRFWQEESQKKILRGAFSRYVAPEVVERITRQRGNIFAGEELELSIMFTDIRGFTSISESLMPEQVVRLLNQYFTPMTSLVKNSGGTLDKFIGDALMAFWNAPLPVQGHPSMALLTALNMQRTLQEINPGLQDEFGVTISMGVGVHTGKAYVGNMGSADLLNYTLIGDNVNLTSRLEGLCSQYGVKIVTSAETKNMCGNEFAFQQLDRLRVKGKNQPVDVFAVLEWKDWEERSAEIQEYLEAYSQYSQGNFNGASKMFSGLSAAYPGVKLYDVYASRCKNLLDSPPQAWDGVWTSVSK